MLLNINVNKRPLLIYEYVLIKIHLLSPILTIKENYN